MSRPPEKSVPALYKYQPVRYSHIQVEPGTSLILTADPWSYLQAWLVQRLKDRRGTTRKRLERAVYYGQLASDFYQAAEASRLPIRGTLAYYGMLNLVKCFLSVQGVELEQSYEHHGLNLPQGATHQVRMHGPANDGVNIFAEFAKGLGTPITGQKDIDIKELSARIPELHNMVHALGFLGATKTQLLPIQISFCTNDQKAVLFTEVKYAKKEELRVNVNKFYKGARQRYFRDGKQENGDVVHRSQTRRRNLSNDRWSALFRNTLKEYQSLDVVSILTRSGYRYYCDLAPIGVHHLCCSLAFMFYVGTVARYRPTEMDSLMTSDLRPLVGEAIATCPEQFLYQLVGLTTKSVCVVPYAKIR